MEKRKSSNQQKKLENAKQKGKSLRRMKQKMENGK